MYEYQKKDKYDFYDLIEIMRILRSEQGCPWDREQDHDSIRKNFIEEVYEVIEAIDKKDDKELSKELGDVLLQVAFHSEIARGEGRFNIDDVTTEICKKLILRHPHVFSNVVAETSGQVLENWDVIKKSENGISTQTQEMKRISVSFPALIRSTKIQQKASKVGFDWNNPSGALDKLREEIGEVVEAYQEKDKQHLEEEIGDMLFAMVNVARLMDVDAEIALTKTCEKFINRFFYIEINAPMRYNKAINELSLDEMDKLWEEYKNLKEHRTN